MAIEPIKVVSLSSVYPNPAEPGLGLFVRARLQQAAKAARLIVIAPLPAIDYSNPQRKWLRNLHAPSHREDCGVEVLHPRWLFPPGGTPLNVLCMFLRLMGTFARLRGRFSFEIIDAHFGYPEGVVAVLLARVFRCHVALTLRGSEPVFAQHRHRRVCLQWAIRRADVVFAVSEELRRFAIGCGADPARVTTSPNGINRDIFYPRDRAQSRAKLDMPSDRTVIVSAGELIEGKGHHLVIEAVRALLAEGRAVSLYIAGGVARGGVPFDKELSRRIAEGNLGASVRLLGWVDPEGLADLLSAADVFCLASFTEGWPNVINEALACGAPVVATRVGAVPEMLPSENYGLVVPPRDQVSLTAALRKAIATDWDRAAIARWGRSRSWEDVAQEVLARMRLVRQQTRLGEGAPQASASGSEI